MISLAAGGGPSEYSRSFGAKALDQATLDAEGYGEKTLFKREDGGLRIVLAPGQQETGWKTPQQIRFGGDFAISAEFVIKKLPKPAQEDGAAIGLAIAFQDANQPDATLVRIIEPKGPDVYRSIEKAGPNQNMMPGPMMGRRGMMVMGMGQPGGPEQKPPRRTFPAAGDVVRMELVREGNTVRYQVVDAISKEPRYLGQAELGAMDVAAVKLFAVNRSGAEPLDVLLRELAIRADRVSGLGTIVRTIYGQAHYAEPSAIENGVLVVGGQPKPAPAAGELPDNVFASLVYPIKKPAASAPAPAAAPATAATPAPGAAAMPAAAAPAVAAAPAAVVVAAAPGVVQFVVAAPAPPMPAGAVTVAAPGATPQVAGAPAPAAAGAAQQAAAQAKPPTRIPLDEVDSIRFERAPTLAARFVGQPNLDFTMPGLSAKKPEAPAKPDEKKSDAAPKAAEKKADAKKDTAPAKAEAKKAENKQQAAPKAETKKAEAKKAEDKKADGSDDALAPPPGTTIAKYPKLEPKKNGIRDLCLSLFGLRDVKIKQVMVNGQSDKGPTSWRLDTTDSQDWPLVVRRAGNDIAADLYLEPPPGDCFQKPFQINVTYEDGQNANATAQANIHTKDDLAIDPREPAFARPDAWIYLAGDEKLFGKLIAIGQETVKIITPWQDHVEVPLARVAGIHIGAVDRKETPDSFAKRLKSRGTEDTLLAQAKNGEVIAIPGIVEGTEDDKLHFRYLDRPRSLSLNQVEGLILAARPEHSRPSGLSASFSLPGGVVVSGRWKDIDASIWKVETPWGQELKLPAAEIQEVRLGGGGMIYLSDLAPSKVEETPFFGHRLPWRKNVSLLGEPLRISGRTYDRGLAVHSRCILTYDLGRRFSSFEALVGFDDAGKGKGRVECRVFADGKELYANPDLKASAPPVPLKVPVAGAERLRLVVDFGRGQDTGDRVIWANARLFRTQPAGAKAPKTAAHTDGPAGTATAVRRD